MGLQLLSLLYGFIAAAHVAAAANNKRLLLATARQGPKIESLTR
jgi:hypothetical protein